MLSARSLLVVAALLGMACQRTAKCDGEPDKDELYRMQELIQDGREPCPEHLEPKIVLDRAGLALNGKLLVRRDELAGWRFAKIKRLFDALKQNRETWKMTHPGRSFDAAPRLEIDPETETAVAASIVMSAAYAGYSNQRLRVGHVELFAPHFVPGPPRDDAPSPIDIRLRRRPNGSLGADIMSGAVVMAASPDLDGNAALAEWVGKRCSDAVEPCANAIVLDVGGAFLGTVELLRDVYRRSALGARVTPYRFAGDPRP